MLTNGTRSQPTTKALLTTHHHCAITGSLLLQPFPSADKRSYPWQPTTTAIPGNTATKLHPGQPITTAASRAAHYHSCIMSSPLPQLHSEQPITTAAFRAVHRHSCIRSSPLLQLHPEQPITTAASRAAQYHSCIPTGRRDEDKDAGRPAVSPTARTRHGRRWRS